MISVDQLPLPFLEAEDAAAIDAARAEVDRSQGRAIAARRWAEADELGRLGTQLVGILERNAAAVRAARPARHPAPVSEPGGMVDQVHPTGIEHPERRT